jgi:two-component system sensor histidine kinase VicK
MDHLQKFTAQFRNRLFILLILNSGIILGAWWVADKYLIAEPELMAAFLASVAVIAIAGLGWLATKYLIQPMTFIWQSILQVAPDTANTPAPNLRHVLFGRELITSLVTHVYQLANVIESVEKTSGNQRPDLQANFVANSLPLPLAVLDKEMNILFANDALLKYTNRGEADTTGQNVYSVLDMSFSNEHTFDRWLEKARADKITATRTWERVRLNLPEKNETRLFDLVAYYNKSNPEGFEIMLVLFDRTRQYSQDDQAMSFVALAVHELRTPLTLLRGYIDVFEEELDGKLDDEMAGFMRKMKAAAQQLAAFTTNVLNVSRFENDQLVLNLQEERWEPLLQSAVNDMQTRADVNGVTIKLQVDDNLPTIGADAVSTYEVIANLLDNAIKYSGKSKEIVVRSYVTKDGLVETTVQDLGVGIPETAMGSLFDKFYRDYHNRNKVGGTGMGLYISKAIVTAHGGNIWVRSKEGQGTTFGFTLVPYSQLADEQKKGDNADVTRTAHGWIKNHSMYRR